MIDSKKNIQKGSALVTLLFVVIMSVTITTGAVTILAINTLTAQKVEQGILVHNLAESAVENALIRIIRDPDYNGEVMSQASGSVEITVVGQETKTITAKAESLGFERTVVVGVDQLNHEAFGD